MSTAKKAIFAAVCLVGLAGPVLAIAPDFMDKLDADSRPMEDKIRDGARRPYQVMMLLGVEEGMTVVDVGAGGGWWTRVLSAAVGPGGKVYSQGLRGDGSSLEALGNVELVSTGLDEMPANVADVAITALNIHHMNDERAGPYFRGLAHILKPGGVAAVIDHYGDASMDNSRLHRIPPAQARAWIEAAGLEIVQESNILRQNADDHSMSATDPRLGRNSDRFFYVVRKPR